LYVLELRSGARKEEVFFDVPLQVKKEDYSYSTLETCSVECVSADRYTELYQARHAGERRHTCKQNENIRRICGNIKHTIDMH
jgi:hypothetical protein